eukprot:scaffold18360_cov114-Isochrysis_galbana.AAC.4
MCQRRPADVGEPPGFLFTRRPLPEAPVTSHRGPHTIGFPTFNHHPGIERTESEGGPAPSIASSHCHLVPARVRYIHRRAFAFPLPSFLPLPDRRPAR